MCKNLCVEKIFSPPGVKSRNPTGDKGAHKLLTHKERNFPAEIPAMTIERRYLLVVSLIGIFAPIVKYSSISTLPETQSSVVHKLNQTNSETYVRKRNGGKHCLAQRTTGPTPVILMTQGRSGSHSTWQILGNLTGYETRADEYTGSSSKESEIFFEEEIGDNHPNWIVNTMCKKQIRALDDDRWRGAESGIVGFNWKPYSADMVRTGVVKGLSVIADLAKSENPREHVKVVRSSRNALDLFLSRTKHKTSNIRAHCYTEECVEKHEKAAQAIRVNCTDVVNSVLALVEQEKFVDDQLAKLEVPTVRVSYDTLYYPETPEAGSAEWNRILAFLGKRSNYSWEGIQSAMSMLPTTTSRSHRDRIENFDELEGELVQVNMQHLLRH